MTSGTLSLPSSAPSVSVAGHVTASSCTLAEFDHAARASPARGFAQVQCADGWALAAGPSGASGDVDLFRLKAGSWTEVDAIFPGNLSGPLQFGSVSIDPALLDELARTFPLSVRQLADAGALVVGLAGHEARLGMPGAENASTVIRRSGETWFVLAGADAANGVGASVSASPYPNRTLRVYRWGQAGWSERGAVSGWMGPIGGCCGIAAVSLTGSAEPDFAMTGGGAADTDWLAIVSDVGGHWHLVPFDYGYFDTTVVNGQPTAHGVSTWVDASSAAGGPTTSLFERYEHGVFRPADPAGPSPPCDEAALQSAADPAQLAVLEFSKFACADGWAVAIGTGAGYTGQVVGLFEANQSSWRTVELDNGDSLGSDPGIYDIPLSLLDELASGLGPAVQPALAIAPIIATRAMIGWTYVNGVMVTGDGDWYVAEKPTGRTEAPGADATVYRWSGSVWVKKGTVDRVPLSLDYYRASSGGWFEAVTVTGTAVPGFIMEGATSPARAVLSDAGGSWHVARFTPSRTS